MSSVSTEEWTMAKDPRFKDFEAPPGRKQRPKLPTGQVDVVGPPSNVHVLPKSGPEFSTSNPYAALDPSKPAAASPPPAKISSPLRKPGSPIVAKPVPTDNPFAVLS